MTSVTGLSAAADVLTDAGHTSTEAAFDPTHVTPTRGLGNMEVLPNEIIERVMHMMPPQDLRRMAGTNTHIRNVAEGKGFKETIEGAREAREKLKSLMEGGELSYHDLSWVYDDLHTNIRYLEEGRVDDFIRSTRAISDEGYRQVAILAALGKSWDGLTEPQRGNLLNGAYSISNPLLAHQTLKWIRQRLLPQMTKTEQEGWVKKVSTFDDSDLIHVLTSIDQGDQEWQVDLGALQKEPRSQLLDKVSTIPASPKRNKVLEALEPRPATEESDTSIDRSTEITPNLPA